MLQASIKPPKPGALGVACQVECLRASRMAPAPAAFAGGANGYGLGRAWQVDNRPRKGLEKTNVTTCPALLPPALDAVPVLAPDAGALS